MEWTVSVIENGMVRPVSEWPTEIQALADGMRIEAGCWQKLGVDRQTIVNQVSGSNNH